MQIATIINVHKDPKLVGETIEAVKRHVTDKILIIVDKTGWDKFKDVDYGNVKKICGYRHHARFSPYKNVALGMNFLYELFPGADWYNYIEYDVLFLNEDFKSDLEEKSNYSMLGFNHRLLRGKNKHWLAKEILNAPEMKCHIMLGAVAFYSANCMRNLVERSFFSELIRATKKWGPRIPRIHHVAAEEILFPSAASLFGRVANMTRSQRIKRSSFGNTYVRYAVRYRPVVKPKDLTRYTSIVHPTKRRGCPIRVAVRNGMTPTQKGIKVL